MEKTERGNPNIHTVRPGILYLIPANIAACPPDIYLPDHNLKIIRNLRIFFVENQRSARRFISGLNLQIDISSLRFEILDKDTTGELLAPMIKELLSGKDAGILSEAGSPGIADPGSALIALAHHSGIVVKPLVGPSSILLALISSGFNGQNFAFNGYLPIDEQARQKKIKELENRVYRENQTQIFMETPYRNGKLMKDLIKTLKPDTLLCLASDLTGESELIQMMPVKKWKLQKFSLDKIPSIFLIFHPGN